MADVAKLVKKLDFVTRKAVTHLRDAKANAVAGENIVAQLRDGAAIDELSSCELAALTENATTISTVIAGFDAVIR